MTFPSFKASAAVRAGRILIVGAILVSASVVCTVPAAANVETKAALEALRNLPPKRLIRVNMLLTALGFYQDKVITAGLETIKGLVKFQQAEDLPVTGEPDRRTIAALEAEGGPVLDYFRFRQFRHPRTGSLLSVPTGLIAQTRQTSRGLLFESVDGDFSADFSFVPANRTRLDTLFARLSGKTTGRRVLYKNIEDSFFVVTGTEGRKIFAAQYHSVNGGSTGYTLRLDPARVHHGDRLILLMAATFQPFPAQPQDGRGHARDGSNPPSAGQATQTGSGFFVTTSGVGVTNHHVINGCQSAEITGHGQAEIVAFDRINDLAILRLEDKTTTTAMSIRQAQPRLGETVFAMGFPLAGALDNGLNFTSGVVSSLAGAGNDSRIIQFTAPIQPGNSGGPLVDNAGALVGVVRAKLNDLAALKASGAVPQNVNFAIKADVLRSFLSTHQIEVPIGEADRPALGSADIAARGRNSAFQVRCQATGDERAAGAEK